MIGIFTTNPENNMDQPAVKIAHLRGYWCCRDRDTKYFEIELNLKSYNRNNTTLMDSRYLSSASYYYHFICNFPPKIFSTQYQCGFTL